jgi:predicted MPP superfamily phosphohydrolase
MGTRGLPPELRPDVEKSLRGRPPNSYPLLLAHQPRAFRDAKSAAIPLTLCGHSHGGQTGIRRWGWSLAGVFIPYHMGLYREDGFQLFVTTGAGNWLVPFRLGLSPEIVIIELKKAQ